MELKAQIRRLKETLVQVERALRAKPVRFFELDHLSGRRVLRTRVEPPPSPSHPWTIAQEAKRFDLLAELKALEANLPPRPRLRPFVQDPSRPCHPSFGLRACRRKVKGARLALKGGRRSVPANRLDLSGLWVRESAAEVLRPLLRVAEPGELREEKPLEARSVLRPLRVEPKHRRAYRRGKRKPFFKAHRNIKS